MDVLLVGFIGARLYGGFRSGFVRAVLGLLFMALSLVIGAYIRYPVGAIASVFVKDVPPDYANLVGYTIAFPAILAGLHLASRTLLSKVAVQGLSMEADKVLGAIFGGAEAILIISAGIVILDTYLGTDSTLRHALGPGLLQTISSAVEGSTTVHILRDTTVPFVLTILGPLLRRTFRRCCRQPSRIPYQVNELLPLPLPSK